MLDRAATRLKALADLLSLGSDALAHAENGCSDSPRKNSDAHAARGHARSLLAPPHCDGRRAASSHSHSQKTTPSFGDGRRPRRHRVAKFASVQRSALGDRAPRRRRRLPTRAVRLRRRGDPLVCAVLAVPELVTPAECAALVEICTGSADEVCEGVPPLGTKIPGLIRLPTIAAGADGSPAPTRLGQFCARRDAAGSGRPYKFCAARSPLSTPSCRRSPPPASARQALLSSTRAGLSSAGASPRSTCTVKVGGFRLTRTTRRSPCSSADGARRVCGGGTGFWTAEQRGHRVEGPSVVLRPEAGSAMPSRQGLTPAWRSRAGDESSSSRLSPWRPAAAGGGGGAEPRPLRRPHVRGFEFWKHDKSSARP